MKRIFGAILISFGLLDPLAALADDISQSIGPLVAASPIVYRSGYTFQISVGASSGLPITYGTNSNSVCTVSGNTVSVLSVGTCILTANQSGGPGPGGNYSAAPTVTTSVTVYPGNQTINFANPGDQTLSIYGDNVAISASTNLSLPISFTSANTSVCTVSAVTFNGNSTSATVNFSSVGQCTIAADQYDGNGQPTTPEVTQTFAINRQAQTISFVGPPTQSYTAGSVAISASTTALYENISFTSLTPDVCTVVDGPNWGYSTGTVSFLQGGLCTIAADQAGDSDYSAATEAQQSFTILPGGLAVSLQAPTAGQIVALSSMPSLAAIASEPGGTIASVVFHAVDQSGNDSVLATATASNGNNIYSTSPSVTSLVGNYQVYAVATDATGQSAITASVPVLFASSQGDGAAFVSQTVPASLRAGQPYTAVVIMQNTGTTTWAANSTYKLGAQDPQDNRTWGTNARVQLTNSIPPGQSVTFGIPVSAPAETTATTIPMQWQMVNEGSGWFGAMTPVANVVVSPGAGPNVSLAATISTDVRMSGSTPATIGFSGSGDSSNDGGAQIIELDLYEDSGTGYGPNVIEDVTGRDTKLAFNGTVNLGAGLYRFKLRATDSNGVQTDSAPVFVSVTNSPLLGQVGGVEVTAANTPQLFGWVCQSGNAQGLAYQIYVNAPANLGGIQIASGVANVSGQVDDQAVQGQCGTNGSRHDFTVDLSSFTSQYGGAPIYVQAQDSSGDSIILPCQQYNCFMPNGLRIGLTTPLNNDQYAAPATVFMRAQVSGGASTASEVNFIINGQSIPATADTTANTYYAVTPNQLAPGTYPVVASITQGDMTLYTVTNVITVVPGNGSTLTMTSPVADSATGTSVALAATQGGNDVPGASVQFYANGSPIATTAPAQNSSGVWSATWVNAPVGNYNLSAKLFDGNGNLLVQAASIPITVNGTGNGTSNSSGSSFASVAAPAVMQQLLANPVAGTLPGSLSVDKNGAATYSIPIAVPPGTNGLAPQLSLNYSSLAGNGIAGYGWSMSGISSITRCIKTIARTAPPARFVWATSTLPTTRRRTRFALTASACSWSAAAAMAPSAPPTAPNSTTSPASRRLPESTVSSPSRSKPRADRPCTTVITLPRRLLTVPRR